MGKLYTTHTHDFTFTARQIPARVRQERHTYLQMIVDSLLDVRGRRLLFPMRPSAVSRDVSVVDLGLADIPQACILNPEHPFQHVFAHAGSRAVWPGEMVNALERAGLAAAHAHGFDAHLTTDHIDQPGQVRLLGLTVHRSERFSEIEAFGGAETRLFGALINARTGADVRDSLPGAVITFPFRVVSLPLLGANGIDRGRSARVIIGAAR